MALLYLDSWIKELEVAVGDDKSNVTKPKSDSNKPNEKVVKEKKEKVSAAPAPPAAPVELNIHSLDLRVGLITSCVKHETADKLYCEEIDIGEPEKRPIASGLVKHYSLDQMQNRKVIVIANLGKELY
jgi:aminoacyl tRNA synthase complex-interacting multifunctional protein 1